MSISYYFLIVLNVCDNKPATTVTCNKFHFFRLQTISLIIVIIFVIDNSRMKVILQTKIIVAYLYYEMIRSHLSSHVFNATYKHTNKNVHTVPGFLLKCNILKWWNWLFHSIYGYIFLFITFLLGKTYPILWHTLFCGMTLHNCHLLRTLKIDCEHIIWWKI
jgi:hypothetical protein